ncbi:MAG: LysR substrate-binding domain-containing protein [Thiothrix sp.]
MFQRNPAQISGRLRVDMPSRIGRRVVIPALPGFLAQHPQLELAFSARDRIVDMVSEGIDCLIRAGDPVDPQLVCRKLGEVELVNCASPAYLARYGLPENSTDLAKHLAVGYAHDIPPPATSVAFEYADKRGVQSISMRSLVSVDNAEAYIASALAGLGIIQVPRFDVQDLLDAGSLREVLPQLRPPSMQLSFLYPKRRNLPTRVKVFQEWVSQLLIAYLANS